MFLHETRKKKSASEQDSASTKISYCFLQFVYIVFTASKEIYPDFAHAEETMEAATKKMSHKEKLTNVATN